MWRRLLRSTNPVENCGIMAGVTTPGPSSWLFAGISLSHINNGQVQTIAKEIERTRLIAFYIFNDVNNIALS
jgi:hypothetical protein